MAVKPGGTTKEQRPGKYTSCATCVANGVILQPYVDDDDEGSSSGSPTPAPVMQGLYSDILAVFRVDPLQYLSGGVIGVIR